MLMYEREKDSNEEGIQVSLSFIVTQENLPNTLDVSIRDHLQHSQKTPTTADVVKELISR